MEDVVAREGLLCAIVPKGAGGSHVFHILHLVGLAALGIGPRALGEDGFVVSGVVDVHAETAGDGAVGLVLVEEVFVAGPDAHEEQVDGFLVVGVDDFAHGHHVAVDGERDGDADFVTQGAFEAEVAQDIGLAK